MTKFSARSLILIAFLLTSSGYAETTTYSVTHPECCTEKKVSAPEVAAPAVFVAPTVAVAPKVIAMDTDKDGVVDELDECPNTPKGYKVDNKGCPSSVSLHIKFATGKWALLPSSDNDVKTLKDFMVENPASKITIVGHTDNVGSKVSNQILSEKRAKALSDRLIQEGISSERIQTEGKGLTQPLAPNNTANGRTQNRRIEIKIS